MAIGPLPPVINEIQANSGQPGKTLAQQTAASSLLDLQATATAEPTTAIVPETTLLEKAVAEALGRQGGHASLYATLTELAQAPNLPDAVKAAVNTLLAFRLDESDVTPERVAQAIRSSGVFHEAVAAGKMAAALPPALKQALGGTQAQTAAPPVASSSTPATNPVARSTAPSTQPSSPNNPGASANAGISASAQAYARQAGLPVSTPTSSATQAPRPAAAVSSNIALSNPAAEVAVVSTASTAAPAVGPAIQAAATSASLAKTAAVPAQTGTAGEPLVETASASSPSIGGLPSASEVARGAPASVPSQMLPADLAGAHPTVPIAGAATPQTMSSSAGPETSMGAMENSPTPGSTMPAPNSARPSPILPSAQPSSVPVAEASVQQPSSPPSPSNGAPAARSFAPWTPGRPLTTALPQTPSDAPVASSSSSAPTASVPTTAPPGNETAIARPPGERAPFVPSAVESLPNSAPGSTAQKALINPTPSLGTQNIPQGAEPQVALPHASTSPLPGSVLTQAPEEPQLPTSPQLRAAMPTSSEGPQVLARQAVPELVMPAVAAPLAPGLDLKGALDLLRRELITWLGRNADVMASLDGTSDDGTTPRVDRPQPPRKGGTMRGQPAITLPNGNEADSSSTETLAGRALGEAERSLSRVFLHQAATAESRDSTKAAQVAQAFVLEIPIAGPNGTSIAQLRIERDDHAQSEPGTPPRRVFQVDIAFDIVPLGPVAVRVGLMDGRRVAVGVWCESDDGLVRMEAERENIVLGLEQEGMVVAGVDLHRGHPPEGHDESVAAPSHRLDLQL